ncbi:hypothetical protein BDD12DRAFT_884607 [Trichophaea hybrida]|nr:hypothetical protein BDD12DRAFT_884607 [Trichophaea hybrida]
MVRFLPSGAKNTTAVAAKDRRHLGKACVYSAEDVVQLREERERIDQENAAKIKKRQDKAAAKAAPVGKGLKGSKHAEKQGVGSKKVDTNCLSDGDDEEEDITDGGGPLPVDVIEDGDSGEEPTLNITHSNQYHVRAENDKVESHLIQLAWDNIAEQYGLHRFESATERLKLIDCLLAETKYLVPIAERVEGGVSGANPMQRVLRAANKWPTSTLLPGGKNCMDDEPHFLMPGGCRDYEDDSNESDMDNALSTTSQRLILATEHERFDLETSHFDGYKCEDGDDADGDEEEEASQANDGSTDIDSYDCEHGNDTHMDDEQYASHADDGSTRNVEE